MSAITARVEISTSQPHQGQCRCPGQKADGKAKDGTGHGRRLPDLPPGRRLLWWQRPSRLRHIIFDDSTQPLTTSRPTYLARCVGYFLH
jgi:hypothetical protein